MKTKINIITALIFFTSCGAVALKFPQPTYLENIERIPSNFHGSFERIDDNKDTIRYKIFDHHKMNCSYINSLELENNSKIGILSFLI